MLRIFIILSIAIVISIAGLSFSFFHLKKEGRKFTDLKILLEILEFSSNLPRISEDERQPTAWYRNDIETHSRIVSLTGSGAFHQSHADTDANRSTNGARKMIQSGRKNSYRTREIMEGCISKAKSISLSRIEFLPRFRYYSYFENI